MAAVAVPAAVWLALRKLGFRQFACRESRRVALDMSLLYEKGSLDVNFIAHAEEISLIAIPDSHTRKWTSGEWTSRTKRRGWGS